MTSDAQSGLRRSWSMERSTTLANSRRSWKPREPELRLPIVFTASSLEPGNAPVAVLPILDRRQHVLEARLAGPLCGSPTSNRPCISQARLHARHWRGLRNGWPTLGGPGLPLGALLGDYARAAFGGIVAHVIAQPQPVDLACHPAVWMWLLIQFAIQRRIGFGVLLVILCVLCELIVVAIIGEYAC